MPSPVRVYFLDVGQGDCTLVVLPDGSGILVDCYDGPAATALMTDCGITHLRAIIATHLDTDHIGGIRSLLNHYLETKERGIPSASPLTQIDSLWLAPDRSRAHISLEAYSLLALSIKLANDLGISLSAPIRDGGGPPKRVWPLGPDDDQPAVIEILLPYWTSNLQGYLDAGREGNSVSAVVRVQNGSKQLIICGDAPLRSLEQLATTPSELRANVVRSPHHGGNILQATTNWRDYQDLYSRAEATLVVHSVGTHNSYGHPLSEHVTASACAGKCHVMCTQMTSKCHDDIDDVRLQTSAFLEVGYPDYRARAGGVACAGTVLVVLADDFDVHPARDEHLNFVKTLSQPMCTR